MIQRYYLECDVVDHCNLRCAHCSHHSPFLAPGTYPLDQFRRDVAALSRALHVRRFRFVGGEPLLAAGLADYVEAVREHDLADQVDVCTNGVILHKVDGAIFDLIDELHVNLYPIASRAAARVRQSCDEIGEQHPRLRLLVKDSDSGQVEPRHRHLSQAADAGTTMFRFSDVQCKNEDPALVEAVYSSCKMGSNCHSIYRGYYLKCIISQRKAAYLEANGVQHRDMPRLADPDTDGVALHKDGLEERLKAYIGSPAPLLACSWCTGSSGIDVPHHMICDEDAAVRTPEDFSRFLNRRVLSLVDQG
jgi:hypothetical protein